MDAVHHSLTARVHLFPAGSLYQEIKKATDSFLGIPSQCIALESSKLLQFNSNDGSAISKRDQYLANLAMKINVKLGGVNVAPVQFPRWANDPFMVIGTCHVRSA